MEDWEYDMFGCPACGSALCDGDCPEEYEQQQLAIARHVETCQADGFCYTCQYL